MSTTSERYKFALFSSKQVLLQVRKAINYVLTQQQFARQNYNSVKTKAQRKFLFAMVEICCRATKGDCKLPLLAVICVCKLEFGFEFSAVANFKLVSCVAVMQQQTGAGTVVLLASARLALGLATRASLRGLMRTKRALVRRATQSVAALGNCSLEKKEVELVVWLCADGQRKRASFCCLSRIVREQQNCTSRDIALC